MTAKVNLLPQASRADAAKKRQRGIAVGIVLFVIVALGLATFLQNGVLNDAEEELANAQNELALAQAEVAALAEFQDLEGRLAESDELAIALLGDEATLAGILQDVALVTPNEGALRTLTIALDREDDSGVGSFTAQAEVLESHAPGVERFLLQLERAAGFRNVFPGGSMVDENDIATFPVTVQLGPEYLTRRYEDGVPEVLR